MRVKPASDLFQVSMVGLLQGMGEAKPSFYVDDIIRTKRDSYNSHLEIFNEILTRLEVGGMQVSAKSVFASIKLD